MADTWLVGEADVGVTVSSKEPAVLAVVRSYVDGYWPRARTEPEGIPRVVASCDTTILQTALERTAGAPEVATYMGAYGRAVELPEGGRLVACPDPGVAFVRDEQGHRLTVTAQEVAVLALGTHRLVREVVSARLVSRGWALVHAAAAERDGRALLAVGGKGSGKTASTLALVAHHGWRLLATDRAFIRAEVDGVRVLPWPSSLNIGLGLLAPLGWDQRVIDAFGSGLEPGYHQRPEVTTALARGVLTPIHADSGREQKCQLVPALLRSILGVNLSSGAMLAGVLRPETALEQRNSSITRLESLRLDEHDTVPVVGEPDWFPDFLGLYDAEVPQRRQVALRALADAASRVNGYRVMVGTDSVELAGKLEALL